MKVFLKYLMIDISNFVTIINKDLDRNRKLAKKVDRRMDQIEIDKLNNGSDSEPEEE